MRGLQGPCASAVSSDVGADRLVALPAQMRCGSEDDEILVPREERVCAGCPRSPQACA